MKVFTEQAVARLAATNKAMRWMRQRDIKPLALNVDADDVQILVPATAAIELSHAAHGYSMSRIGGKVTCTTKFLGCTFAWQP